MDKNSSGTQTPNNSLEVLSGIALLAEQFLYLNFIFVVVVPYQLPFEGKTRNSEGAEYGSLYYELF
jgi:hypothetical protein